MTLFNSNETIFCSPQSWYKSISLTAGSEWDSCSTDIGVSSVLNCAYNTVSVLVLTESNYTEELYNTCAAEQPGSASNTQISFTVQIPITLTSSSNEAAVAAFKNSFLAGFALALGVSPDHIVIEIIYSSRRKLADSSGIQMIVTVKTTSPLMARGIFTSVQIASSASSSSGSNTVLSAVSDLVQSSLTAPGSLVSAGIVSSNDVAKIVSQVSVSAPTEKDTCQDFPGWVDARGTTCTTYASSNLCTTDGGYGTGWYNYARAFKFPQLASARTRLVAPQACCACGGGLQELQPSTITVTPNSVSDVNLNKVLVVVSVIVMLAGQIPFMD